MLPALGEIMRDWKFWDWFAYAGLLVAAIFIAAKEQAWKVPSMNWLSEPIWSVVPLILTVGASLLLGARALGWIGPKQISHGLEQKTPNESGNELKKRAFRNRLLMTAAASAPYPVFGSPRQEATEPFRSWWHVPITVSESTGQNKIDNATIELRWDGHSGPATLLQWREAGIPAGIRERTLLEGRNALVPIVLRDEGANVVHGAFNVPAQQRLGARITGTAYLADGANKFPMPPGRRLFRLVVRSGKDDWQSPHRYVMTIPPEDESNGHFNLQVWHEGKD